MLLPDFTYALEINMSHVYLFDAEIYHVRKIPSEMLQDFFFDIKSGLQN